MSKLNDSTLKILKKYRLDTDMSVFGNENKLYDVVKVMDDMVGNQVSKYKAFVSYASSIKTETGKSYSVNADSVFKDATKSSSITSPDILIIVDALSYKVLSIIEKPNAICIGYLQGTTKVLGYVCYNIENMSFGVYSDIAGTQSLTGTRCEEKFGFIPFILFSSNTVSLSSSTSPYVYVSSIVSNVNENNDYQYNYIATGDITIPKEIVNLLPQGYYGYQGGHYYLGVSSSTPYKVAEVEYDI